MGAVHLHLLEDFPISVILHHRHSRTDPITHSTAAPYPCDMELIPTDEKPDVCSTCNCLGYRYCDKRGHDQPQRPSLTVLSKRTFHDFRISAAQGCRFCDVALQSFMLFQSVNTEMRVELLIYSQSPAELHYLANRDMCDAVEIYACEGKLSLSSCSSCGMNYTS